MESPLAFWGTLVLSTLGVSAVIGITHDMGRSLNSRFNPEFFYIAIIVLWAIFVSASATEYLHNGILGSFIGVTSVPITGLSAWGFSNLHKEAALWEERHLWPRLRKLFHYFIRSKSV